MSAGLAALPATTLIERFRAREASPVELIDELAERIGVMEPTINAFTTPALERARAAAARAQAEYRPGGAPRALEGLPLAVKDLIDTAGIRTTYGSRMFADHVPGADAAIVAAARDAGAIVIGKTSTHEFAWGITSDNPHFGACRNPWRTEYVPGGSSGGSAAALAAFEAPLALGTDTGGSVRIPAGFCGVVGFKPSRGRLGTDGIFPLAPSLDHAGVLARTPADAALLFGALAGEPPIVRAALAGLRVGLMPSFGAPRPTPEVAAACESAARVLEQAGASICETSFSLREPLMDTFAAIQGPEVVRTHSDRGLYPARRDEYGPDVRARLDAATGVGPDRYAEAQERRREVEAEATRLFREVDVLLGPVASGPPALIGAESVELDGIDVPFRDVVMPHMVLANLAGLPSCVMRGGIDALGLPIGVQLTLANGEDWLTLALAAALFENDPVLQSAAPDPT